MRPDFFTLAVAAILALPAAGRGETNLDYSSSQGYSSNLFSDPIQLSGPFWEGSLKLRGTIGDVDQKISYAVSQTEKKTGSYRFGDTHETGFNLGYAQRLNSTTLLELEAAYLRSSSGDVFLSLPGTLIGYRSIDSALQFGGKITTTGFGGKTVFTAKYGELRRGTADFTLDLLRPAKLDPDVSQLTLGASQYVAALGGELCYCVQYNRSSVAADEQIAFVRYPASTLRGSLAYAREVRKGLTLIGEAGISVLSSEQLKRKTYPFLRAQIEWKPLNGTTLTASYLQDLMLADIDDAVAEVARTYKLSASQQLNSWATLTVAYERTASEYVFYIYDRTRTSYSAKLVLGTEKSPKLAIEYSHERQAETEPSAGYQGNTILAKLTGTF